MLKPQFLVYSRRVYSKKMEEKLIEAVRVRQVLYDTSHADYMRTKLKTEKWEEIAKEIGMKNGKFIYLF